MKVFDFQIVVIPEAGSFSAWCPDLDVASQGDSIEEAIANLKEAIELHIECLTPLERSEFKNRGQKLMTNLEVALA
ncbi:MAG: type II toxin-antitoxin system HicB family antitoxin [Candidatus Diapherotrites archaeon]|nr:type II toxin-antitoxin system HicB family antitoxin [Candidatus Diapherotrites archaeon]